MPQNVVSQFKRSFSAPLETDRQVDTPTQRDAINSATRWEGMLVYVVSEAVTYELRGGVTNADWAIFGAGASSGSVINGLTFNPDNGVLTISFETGPGITVDLSAYTVLKIAGFQVKKGTGNTNFTTVEIGDYLSGWDGDRDVAFKVTGLPHTSESNRKYTTNNSPGL